jgi:Glyoxalase-like domain
MVSKIETETVQDDSAEMADLMAKWDAENPSDPKDADNDSDVEDDCQGYDDELEKYRRDVYPNDNELDHVLLGTANLESAMQDFEQKTGVKPVMVTSLKGCGTVSARLAFENCIFLEIVAPDPKQPDCTSALKERLAQLPVDGKTSMVPLGYAVRHKKALDMQKERFEPMGFACDQVTMVAHDRMKLWKWDMVFLEGPAAADDGGLVPFFVNWGDAHHAAGRLPILGTLDSVTVRAPVDHKVHQLLQGVSDVKVDASGDEKSFEFTFTSKNGSSHTYSGTTLIGVSFPKEGGLPVKTLS